MPETLQSSRHTKLKQLRAMARLLDESLAIPGTSYRFGLDSLIGLVPGAGDLIGAVLSAYIINEAVRLGIPRRLAARMVANTAIDLLGGAVPVLGDLFDVAWKANVKNVELLEEHLKTTDPATWAPPFE
jgi:hypothetical protein